MSRRVRIALKAVVWGVCLSPLALLMYRFATDDLGANPIAYATAVLGDTTLRLLLASLAMTPLRLLFAISWPMSLRRLLGLFAFFYASVHLSVWVVADHFFDWTQMLADVAKRRYITVGVLAFALLVPLAATSTTGMVKRLGGTTWRRLHRLVYVAGLLAVIHFLWLAKVGRIQPFVYARIFTLLVGIRLWGWARRAAGRRRLHVKPVEGFGILPGRQALGELQPDLSGSSQFMWAKAASLVDSGHSGRREGAPYAGKAAPPAECDDDGRMGPGRGESWEA